MTPFSSSQYASVQRTIARSAGKAAAIYGYPMVEMLRACRLHTRSSFDDGKDSRPLINTPDVSDCATVWISLGDGPKRLSIDCDHLPGQGSSLLLRDAYGEPVEGFDFDCLRDGVVLIGPRAELSVEMNVRPVRCASDLVWLVCRSGNDGATDVHANAWMSGVRVEGLAGGDPPSARRPASVELWEGEPTDAFVEAIEGRQLVEALAPIFFANLCRAMAQAPGRMSDRPLIARIKKIGLGPEAALDWNGFAPAVRKGLTEGFLDAAQLVIDKAIQASGEPTGGWPGNPTRSGDYLQRAVATRNSVDSDGVAAA